MHWLYHAIAWTWGGDGTGGSNGTGYLLSSGPVPDLALLVIVGAAARLVRHHICHVDGCHRLGRPDPEHGYPACRTHHTRSDLLGKAPS
jgi:hypothetical protein